MTLTLRFLSYVPILLVYVCFKYITTILLSLNLQTLSIYSNQLNQSEALGPEHKQDQIKILFQHIYSNSESLIKQKSTAAGPQKLNGTS